MIKTILTLIALSTSLYAAKFNVESNGEVKIIRNSEVNGNVIEAQAIEGTGYKFVGWYTNYITGIGAYKISNYFTLQKRTTVEIPAKGTFTAVFVPEANLTNNEDLAGIDSQNNVSTQIKFTGNSFTGKLNLLEFQDVLKGTFKTEVRTSLTTDLVTQTLVTRTYNRISYTEEKSYSVEDGSSAIYNIVANYSFFPQNNTKRVIIAPELRYTGNVMGYRYDLDIGMTMFRSGKNRTPLQSLLGIPSHNVGAPNYVFNLFKTNSLGQAQLLDCGNYFTIGSISVPVYIEKYGSTEKYYGIYNSYTRSDSSTIIVRAENINDFLSTVDVLIQYPQNGEWKEERTFGVNWSPNTAVKVVKRGKIVINGKTHTYILTIPVNAGTFSLAKPTLVFITNPEKIKISRFSEGGYLVEQGKVVMLKQ